MLKPPPAFVKNEAAWAYTLAKLAEKDQLDAEGNPLNYGGAIAIYKRVVRKYGDSLVQAPVAVGVGIPTMNDDDERVLTGNAWTLGHNVAWANGVGYTMTLSALTEMSLAKHPLGSGQYVVDPLIEFRAHVHDEDEIREVRVPAHVGLAFTRGSDDCHDWAQAQLQVGLYELRYAIAECEGDAMEIGKVEITCDPHFFDREGTLALLRAKALELEQALEADALKV